MLRGHLIKFLGEISPKNKVPGATLDHILPMR